MSLLCHLRFHNLTRWMPYDPNNRWRPTPSWIVTLAQAVAVVAAVVETWPPLAAQAHRRLAHLLFADSSAEHQQLHFSTLPARCRQHRQSSSLRQVCGVSCAKHGRTALASQQQSGVVAIAIQDHTRH